ncbi:Nod factor-specific ABC transporter NodJ protein [Bradyrhizobium sp. LM3.4]
MWQRFAPALPANPWNWIAVWRRNFLVWRKVALASVLGNLAEPMSSLFGLGFGLGMIIGGVEGTSYISFLAAGMVATSAMVSATFETIYAAYARMQTNCTWEAVLCTPLTLGDIVLGEVAWAASKALLAGTAITIVAVALGYADFRSGHPSPMRYQPSPSLALLSRASQWSFQHLHRAMTISSSTSRSFSRP